MIEKEWYKSKSLLVGILAAVGGLCTTFAGQLEAGIPLTIMGVAQIILRVVTKTALK